MKRTAVMGLVCLATVVFSGCQNSTKETTERSIALELRQKNIQLQRELTETTSERDQLEKQVDVLTDIGTKIQASDIYDLTNVRVGNYTGFYDKDSNGKKEKLIVYLQPIDAQGDVVKAVGDVDVQLWDLNKKNHAMLKQWKVGPDELKKYWYTMLIINYRLTFDVSDIAADLKDDLTVRVIFTDHLSGKVFKEQKVTKP